MLRRLGLIALVVGLLSTTSLRGEENTASLFIIHFSTGPAWVVDKPFAEQPHAGAHSANLARLRKEGTVVLGARYADKGMIVLRADSEAQARAEIEKDKAVQEGTFAYTIAELRPFYDGCVSREPAQN
jgi:uncharacterized protein YciI